MKSILRVALAGLGAALLWGCVHVPTGPTVAVMPAPYKPFGLFADDDSYCRYYARQRLSGAVEEAQSRATGTAVAGAAIGAIAGGLIGGRGSSAATGAGVGLAAGTISGAADTDESSWGLQRRYDIAYEQCMYARGNQVPGYAPVNVPPPPPPPAPPQPRSR